MIMTRLRNMGLGTRIAVTILLAIVLIQALNVAAFVLIPRPTEKIYSAIWLADRSAEAAKLFALAEKDRRAAAENLSRNHGLVISFEPKPHPPDPPPPPGIGVGQPPAMQQLKALVEDRLGAASGISVKVERRLPPPPLALAPLPSPPQKPPSSPPGPLPPRPQSPDTAPDSPDPPIWGRFRITLTGATGDWVVIKGEPAAVTSWLFGPHVMSGVLAVVLVALLSAWTAKRSLAPLEHLAVTARRMGHERVPTPVETKHLGDFAVVGDALNDMQDKIRAFIDDRTQMIGAISHDMRTGLTRLRLGAEEVPESPAKNALVAAIEDMDQMITATLTLAGDDRAHEPSTSVDVAAIVITCCDTLQDLGATVSYEGTDHAPATCQPVALKRAIMNVVENAVKYGYEARVNLIVQDDRILITVRDKGRGIPEHLIPEAMRPFRRLETSRSRETGGAGLGLAIARDVMSAHGGTLRLENHPEGGLLATLELPRTGPSHVR